VRKKPDDKTLVIKEFQGFSLLPAIFNGHLAMTKTVFASVPKIAGQFSA
jgi:hypothetical protein